MLSRAAVRSSKAVAGRRAFHATPSRFSTPYHYPEGPYTNIPFNPRKKTFGLKYWTSMVVAFSAPFGIAGRFPLLRPRTTVLSGRDILIL